MDNEYKKRDLAVFVIVIFSVILIYQNQIKSSIKNEVAVADSNTTATTNKDTVDYFKDIQIEGKAGYVFDVKNNKILFYKNADSRLPIASITKIMTTIVSRENFSADGKDFAADQLNNLTTAMLMESNNDAAQAIANIIETDSAKNFVELMNKKAGELGLSETIFANPTGLDTSSTTAGAYGSAIDVAKMLTYGYQKYSDVFGVTKLPEAEVDGRKIINKNILVGEEPEILAGKTGLTNLAGGNLAVLFGKPESFFAIVVLGSSEKGRFEDVKKLIDVTTLYEQNR